MAGAGDQNPARALGGPRGLLRQCPVPGSWARTALGCRVPFLADRPSALSSLRCPSPSLAWSVRSAALSPPKAWTPAHRDRAWGPSAGKLARSRCGISAGGSASRGLTASWAIVKQPLSGESGTPPATPRTRQRWVWSCGARRPHQLVQRFPTRTHSWATSSRPAPLAPGTPQAICERVLGTGHPWPWSHLALPNGLQFWCFH